MMISKTRIKNILRLKQKNFREKSDQFLIEGARLCLEALQSDFMVETLLIDRELIAATHCQPILDLAHQKIVEIIEIDEVEVDRLADTVHSQGIFGVVKQRRYRVDDILTKDDSLILIIAGGQDPGNVGTIIRTCDWFNVAAVMLSKGSVELYNPKVVRASMGSIFHVPIVENIELIELLPRFKKMEFQIYAADVRGAFLFHELDYRFPLALLIGNENKGLDPHLFEFIDRTVKIPALGKAESLNMATAAAIILSRMMC